MKYSRKFMREHYKSNCYVSNDGLHVERDYFDPKLLRKRVQELTTHLDAAEDRFYVLVSGKGKFYIDEMVLACYRGTMKDGKKYLVHHIDGDMRNSEVSNLEWREATPEYLQDRQKIIAASIDTSALRVAAAKKQAEMERYKSNNIEVNSKGQILQNGQLVLEFFEEGFNEPFYSQKMSDGTLKLFAYYLLLHEKDARPLVFIEEPDFQQESAGIRTFSVTP